MPISPDARNALMSSLSYRSFAVAVIIIAQFGLMGCTSAQLRRSTVCQSTTLSDINTEQVMNNLAMFIHNPAAVPYFAYPNQGTTAIQDSANVAGLGYSQGTFASSPFGLGASRQATENWVLVPVSDASKLALMRCAYQQALAPIIGADLSMCSICPDCQKLREDFHGESETAHMMCLNNDGCWLRWGTKKDVPPDCRPPYVGCYRGTYVWIAPEGHDMLARLTLTILDYAANDPTQFATRTKTVELTLGVDGKPDKEGPIKISTTIPIDQSSKAVAVFEQAAYGLYGKLYSKEDATSIEDALVAYVYRLRCEAHNPMSRSAGPARTLGCFGRIGGLRSAT
jgi:hypothetical protein